MSRFISLFIFLTSSLSLFSQNYVAYSNQFDKLYGGKNEVDITHLKRFGFHDVFKYNENDYNHNKDSIHVLSKIKYVEEYKHLYHYVTKIEGKVKKMLIQKILL